MALSARAEGAVIGRIGLLKSVEVPWPIKVQVIDVREVYGRKDYMVADAGSDDGPAGWVMASRVTLVAQD